MGYEIKKDGIECNKGEAQFCKDLILFLNERDLNPKTAAPMLARAVFLIEKVAGLFEEAGVGKKTFQFKQEYLKLIEEKNEQ